MQKRHRLNMPPGVTRRLILCLSLALAAGFLACSDEKESDTAGSAHAEDGFVSLFNGEDLTGWKTDLDNGTFFVKDSAIVCTGELRPPKLIWYERELENFILELDYKIVEGGNSGMFIHAPRWGRQSRVGFELQILGDYGRTPDTHTTGAIYDVLPPRHNPSRPAREWNHARVEVDWPSLKVWWNGRQIHDVDFRTNSKLRFRQRRGLLALQNHGHHVEFKNIRIKELQDTEQWEVLFNGKDLSGWKTVGNANWHVKNGEIVADRGRGFLVSMKRFEDFQFQCFVNMDSVGYGGIFYRWRSPDDPGYEAEFYHYWNATKDTAKYGDHWPEGVMPVFMHDYLLYQIMSLGRESEVRINGLPVSRRINHTVIRPGHIAFEFDPRNTAPLRIRSVRVKSLGSWW